MEALSNTHELIEWGAAAQAHRGENLSGDCYLILPLNDRVLIAVIDGVGHGPEAASASQAAAAAIERGAEQSLVSLFIACHGALRHTRGVVMTLAAIDAATNGLAWVGVGNVEARLLRAGNSSGYSEESLLLRGGTVGYDVPDTLSVSVLPISRGDVLVLATDGIHAGFTAGVHIGRSAQQIANEILTRHSKETDDALVLVAKYRGR